MMRMAGAGGGGLIVVAAAARGWMASLFSARYLPHRFCYLADPGLVWTNVGMDGLIAASYAAIFVSLMWIAMRLRRLASFQTYLWIFISFGMFILACGATHVMEMVTVWWPVYPLSAAVKVVCAAASVPTAILFARATPALAQNLRGFMEAVAEVERERDQALSTASTWERLVEERRRAAQELAEAYTQLNSALECTSDMVMTIGHDWVVQYGNGKTLENLPDFKVGESYWSCFPAVAGTQVETQMRTAMEQRRPAEWENFYAPYGRWYRVQAYPSEQGLSVFFRDITDERAMRELLEQEQMLREKRVETLSHMAGGLAHEISNPLAIIHARANDLKKAACETLPLSRDLVCEACTSIVNTSDRAMRILRGLRGFGREASQDPKEWASFYDIVEQALEMQTARYDRHEIALSWKLENNLPLVLCRETQIGQIVTNLLNNAFDAIQQGNCTERWVSLEVKSSDGEIRLDIEDSGPGVPEEFRPHLMQPFFTTKMGLGLGVGLSLSRAIAQDHGGSLDLVAGTGPTRFRLRLPIGSEEAEREEEAKSAGQAR